MEILPGQRKPLTLWEIDDYDEKYRDGIEVEYRDGTQKTKQYIHHIYFWMKFSHSAIDSTEID